MANRIFLDAAIGTAWSHWTALGVNGVAPPPDTAVDPEALILLTAVIADDEPRRRDEATDWCVQFGSRFVAAGRMRALAAGLDQESASRFRTFAATTNELGGTRWHSGSARPRKLTPSGKSRLHSLDTELALSGAPAEIVKLAEQAHAEEAQHAAVCGELARLYAGEPIEPVAPRNVRLADHARGDIRVRTALHVLHVCCISETIATAFVEACLGACCRARLVRIDLIRARSAPLSRGSTLVIR